MFVNVMYFLEIGTEKIGNTFANTFVHQKSTSDNYYYYLHR